MKGRTDLFFSINYIKDLMNPNDFYTKNSGLMYIIGSAGIIQKNYLLVTRNKIEKRASPIDTLNQVTFMQPQATVLWMEKETVELLGSSCGGATSELCGRLAILAPYRFFACIYIPFWKR